MVLLILKLGLILSMLGNGSQTGHLVVWTRPGAEVDIGCGDITIGSFAHSDGKYEIDLPAGPNCVTSLGIIKRPVIVVAGKTVETVFFWRVWLIIIRGG